MIDAVAGLIEAGRVKFYSVDSRRSQLVRPQPAPGGPRRPAWQVRGLDPQPGPLHPRRLRWPARHHGHRGQLRRLPRGQLRLPPGRPVPHGHLPSGVYDAGQTGWRTRRRRSTSTTTDYVANLGGDHLDWLRGRLSLLLVCGQGQWEDTTGALESTKVPSTACSARRASATRPTCGATTSPTTGRPGGPSSPTIAAVV